jgi:hypothetical protein
MIFLAVLLGGVVSIISPIAVKAICPVCTIAVGAGVGLSRWLGIDDTITGLWVGGLTVSMIMWTNNWLRRKNWYIKGYNIFVAIVYFGVIVVPLYIKDIIGHPYNRIFGIDKLLAGMIVGSILFYAGAIVYNLLKKRNSNKAYFPFQKVVMPVGPLIILSIILFFLVQK